MEQTPNPYAFSVGNADRIFEPYRAKNDLDRDTTAALLKHMLVFYNIDFKNLSDLYTSWSPSKITILSLLGNESKNL